MWKRVPAFLAALVLLTLSVSANAVTLESGSRGEDVLKLKERMYELGYYRTNDFNDIYNNIAVERVKQLLANGNLPLKVLSDFCGFGHPNSLRKFFLRATGMTMSAWRDRNAPSAK